MQTAQRISNGATVTEPIPAAFRAHFARHNRQVLFLALGTALGAVALWLTAYFVAYWFVLLALSAAYGIEGEVPAWFVDACVFSAFVLCLATWAIHRLSPSSRARDRSSVVRLIGESLLAVPRATMSVWGTLSAYQRFNDHEMALAFRLLKRIEQVPRLSLQSVPLEIPEPQLRDKILHGLQMVALVDLTKNSTGWWLKLRDRSVRALCHQSIRLKQPDRQTAEDFRPRG